MSLNQTKFDDKMMIYIESCIQKVILNLLGVPYSRERGPQNPDF